MSKRQRLHVSQLPAAEKLIGLHFTAQEHKVMIDDPNGQLAALIRSKQISSVELTKLYGEAAALSVAKAYQDATDFHLRVPDFSTN